MNLKRSCIRAVQFSLVYLLLSTNHSAKAQLGYTVVDSVSYTSIGLRPRNAIFHPTNPAILYVYAQDPNANWKGFFDTYDVTNPYNIVRTKRFSSNVDSFGISDIVIEGNILYGIGSKGMHVFNISNPSNPLLTNVINTVANGSGTVNIGYSTASLLKVGSNMFTGGFNFHTVNISNLASPTRISGFSYIGINGMKLTPISNNRLLCGDGYDLIVVNHDNPSQLSSTKLSSLAGDPSGAFWLQSKNIIIATHETSTQEFIYVLNGTNYAKIDSINYAGITGFGSVSSHANPWVLNDTLYVATSNSVAAFRINSNNTLSYVNKLVNGSGSSFVHMNTKYLISNNGLTLKFYHKTSLLLGSQEENIKSEQLPSIFPMPASNYFTVKNNYIKYSNYVLLSSEGKKIEEGIMDENSTTIHTDGLKPGIYFLKCTSREKIYISKIIIE
jgi:hypothetical protein